MTLHCNTKTKNINLFLPKVQLLPEADTDSYAGEICNVRKCSRNLWNSLTATYSGRLGDRYTGLCAQTLASKKSFSSFLFQLYFNKKQVEVAINDFTMHLIISKWLTIQRCWQKRKTMRQRGRNEEETVNENVLIHLTYVVDHASVHFFFYVKSLLCFVCSFCITCCIF